MNAYELFLQLHEGERIENPRSLYYMWLYELFLQLHEGERIENPRRLYYRWLGDAEMLEERASEQSDEGEGEE